MKREDCKDLIENGIRIKNCTKTVQSNYLLRKPMLFYSVGPMYQNYNHYMKSEVIQELYGKWDEDKDTSVRCRGSADGLIQFTKFSSLTFSV